MPPHLEVAVIGGGWSGLAAGVQATLDGHQVTLFEMAAQMGGRARSVNCQGEDGQGLILDNGQHILIGAYRQSLALMSMLGVDATAALQRLPLRLRYPDFEGLSLPSGPHPILGFAVAALRCRQWHWRDRMSLLGLCASWAAKGFTCDPQLSVAELCAGLSKTIRDQLIDPLCVAALNTPMKQASATVFLRVLRDALFSAKGASDLLLPKLPLSDLVAKPGADWLASRGAKLLIGHRVDRIAQAGPQWLVDGRTFDAVILACTASEAARLVGPIDSAWSRTAAALRYEPIVTVYLHSAGSRFPLPMMALHSGPEAPAQFAFDLGALHQDPRQAGRFALVISDARAWLDQGLTHATQATLAQARQALGAFWMVPPVLLRALTEKRATFACTPGLQRPWPQIAPGLLAAGDYVHGPYPATLEAAVMAGFAAAKALPAPLTR